MKHKYLQTKEIGGQRSNKMLFEHRPHVGRTKAERAYSVNATTDAKLCVHSYDGIV